MAEARRDAGEWAWFEERFAEIQANIGRVIQGKEHEVRLALVTLVAEGHLLIEDVPGVGKTMLAKAIARSFDCAFRRIQFTPDLLPTDITGVNVYNQERGDFEFKPGAVFANIVLGDEINRASPKTQSALLESMEERQVTVDGVSYELGVPFMVIATQNPIEHEGTYPLPEAQLDRFMMRLSIGYPGPEAEATILATHGKRSTLEDIGPVTDASGAGRYDRGGPAGLRGGRAPAIHRRHRGGHPPPPRRVPGRQPSRGDHAAPRRTSPGRQRRARLRRSPMTSRSWRSRS